MTIAPDLNGERTGDHRGLVLYLTLDTKRMYIVTAYKDLESEVENKQRLMSWASQAYMLSIHII
jgi:hypothetical protein